MLIVKKPQSYTENGWIYYFLYYKRIDWQYLSTNNVLFLNLNEKNLLRKYKYLFKKIAIE